MNTNEPELRQDIVSNDWILLAKSRAKRPHAELFPPSPQNFTSKRTCPFENPRKAGNKIIASYPEEKNWFVQVIGNKYPAVITNGTNECPVPFAVGAYRKTKAVGFHDVIVTRSHERSLGEMTVKEGVMVIEAWRNRMRTLKEQPCVDYIIVFHNHGKAAGASISHPHSQIITTPVVPPDVARSLVGARRFFEEKKECVHCVVLKEELHEQKRVIFQNDRFLVFTPFASHVNFEMRIMPLAHELHFEDISPADQPLFAEALINALAALYKKVNNPSYNFFVHTTPPRDHTDFYHWHLEILPKTTTWAGLEFGTGLETIVVAPEDAAQLLRSK
jgi:UDPglucose--hexose-1-phosphate uridylyltransferase